MFDQKKIHDNFNQAVLTDKLTSFPIANQYLSNTNLYFKLQFIIEIFVIFELLLDFNILEIIEFEYNT